MNLLNYLCQFTKLNLIQQTELMLILNLGKPQIDTPGKNICTFFLAQADD